MPLSDATFWQEVAKWFAGIAGAIATLFGLFLRWWVGDRFKKVDKRIDSVEEKTANHDTALVRLETHMEHSQDDRKEIHKKLDNIHDLLIKHGTGD